MSLLSYSDPSGGTRSVLVSLLSEIPLEITVYDSQDITTTLELIDDGKANTIQIGPSKGRSYDLILRAINLWSEGRRTITSILPGAIFSQTASVSGNSRSIQCGGDMWLNETPVAWKGARMTLPRGSTVTIANSGEVTVRHNGRTMTLREAAELNLLLVEI
jgi:hypothetical protein